MRRPIVCVAAQIAIATAVLTSTAGAQTGPFVPAQTYWIGPIGGAGVEILSGQIWIDRDGSDTNNAGDTFHPIPAGLASGWDFRLTPSRSVMVAVTSSGASCPGTAASIRLYTIPPGNGASLVQLGAQQNLARCIDQVGFSDSPTDNYRTGFWRESPHPTSGQANILWWDLITGAAGNATFPFDQGFGFIDFAPSGTMAWVQHGLSAPQGTKYSLVELCPSSIGLSGAPLTNQTGVLRAHVEVVAGGGLGTVIRNGTTYVTTLAYEDCQPPPPGTGACCLADFTGCVTGVTQAICQDSLQGNWQGDGSTCTPSPCPPPPMPQLTLTKSAPGTVERGANLVYTLIARNIGTGPAASVVVTDSIPLGMFFIAASNGGTYDGFTRKVSWTLGTMNPGAQMIRTLTVQAPCNGATAVNGNYAITGTPGGTVVGSPVVTTTLTAFPTTALNIALSSQALAATPLQTGDRVRHTVQITNTLAQIRWGVRFTFQPGAASDIAAVIDSGGGNVQVIGAIRRWEGHIGPNATVNVVWEDAIRECRPSTPSTEIMNNGVFINLTNRCQQFLGFSTPTQSFAVSGNPISMRFVSSSHGPGTPYSGSNPPTTLFVARPGATVDMQMRIINASATTGPASELQFFFPSNFEPAGDPPFIGTPPAGAVWNPDFRTISWSGTPPANDSVSIAFRGVLGTTDCFAQLPATCSYGTCIGGLSAMATLVGVNPAPAGAHLIAVTQQNGVWTWLPGGAEWEPLLCNAPGGLSGIGRSPDGTLWIMGSPPIRLQPATPALAVLANGVFGIDIPFDVGVDPRDSTLVVAGYQVGFGMRVRRYDPDNGQITPLLTETSVSFGPGQSVVVDTTGFIGVQYQGGVVRIDPANPPAFQNYTSPSFPGIGALALDLDQNYLVAESFGPPRRLAGVHRTTGAYTSLYDLDAVMTPGASLSGLAVAENQDVYVGDDQGGAIVIHRASGSSIETLAPLFPIVDLHFVNGPTVDVPTPDPVAAPVALALSRPHPNPFVRNTTLRLAIPRTGEVALEIYDLGGRRVRTLVAGRLEPGEHAVRWDGHDDGGRRLGPGVYLARLRFDGEARRAKLVLAP